MKFELRRVILFVKDVDRIAAFYKETFGLRVLGEPSREWIELDAGGCRLALHAGGAPRTWQQAPKLVFHASDVTAAREELLRRGATLGPVKTFGTLELCDGADPEGNAFQLSNRA